MTTVLIYFFLLIFWALSGVGMISFFLWILYHFFDIVSWFSLVRLIKHKIWCYTNTKYKIQKQNFHYWQKWNNTKDHYSCSLLFDLFLEFIPINDFLEIPKSFRRIIKDFWVLDAFAYNFVKDDLEPDWNSWPVEVVVVVFTDFLYLGVSALLLSLLLRAVVVVVGGRHAGSWDCYLLNIFVYLFVC